MQLLKKRLYDILLLLMSCIIVSNVYFANKKALQMFHQYESSFAYMVQLVGRLQEHPDFDRGITIAIVGLGQKGVYPFAEFGEDKMIRMNLPWMAGSWREQFIKYYGGFDIKMASEVESFIISQTEEYKAMNTYPYHGSIKRLGDFLVVKMQDIIL